jgi:hypothetical protein
LTKILDIPFQRLHGAGVRDARELLKSDVFSFGVMVLEIMTGKKHREDTWRSPEDDLLSLLSASC